MSIGSYIILIACTPAFLVGWPIGCLMMLFGIARAPRLEGHGVLSLEWTPRFAELCRYSISWPKLMCYQPGGRDDDAIIDTRTECHEHVHDRQLQDNMMTSLGLGLGVFIGGLPVLSAALWCSGILWLLIHYLTAALRYGWRRSYRDAEHERSAYAQTDKLWFGKSWLSIKRRK